MIRILVLGSWLAFVFKKFVFVPFPVLIMGIVSFCSVLGIFRVLSGSNKNEMRKSITIELAVNLGLIPTLAFPRIYFNSR